MGRGIRLRAVTCEHCLRDIVLVLGRDYVCVCEIIDRMRAQAVGTRSGEIGQSSDAGATRAAP